MMPAVAANLAYAIIDYVYAESRSQEMIIQPEFKPYLLAVPNLMEEEGVRLIEIGGCMVMDDIGKVVLDGTEFDNPYEIFRKGEILARLSLLELIGPVANATSRRVGNEAIAERSGQNDTLAELFKPPLLRHILILRDYRRLGLGPMLKILFSI